MNNKFLWGIMFLSLIIGSGQALTLGEGITIYPADGNAYTTGTEITVTDLNLTMPYFGDNTLNFKNTPSVGTTNSIIYNFVDNNINVSQNPSVNQQITNYFNGLEDSTTFYAWQNGTYKGSFTVNNTGYGKYYAPYRSTVQLWNFVKTAPTTTTITTTTTTLVYYPIYTTTTLQPYNNSYIVPDNYYLKLIADSLNSLLPQAQVTEGACQLMVDNESFYGSPEILKTTYDTEYTYTEFLNSGEYYWRVRCYYYDRWSMWSETKHFTHKNIGNPIYFDWTVEK